MASKWQYWGAFGVLAFLSLLLMPESCDDLDPNCETNTALEDAAAAFCCLSFVPLGLALFTGKKKANYIMMAPQQQAQTVVINNQQVQPQQQYIPPRPAPAPRAPAPPPKSSPGGDFAAQRKKAQMDRALKMELRGDLEGAKTAYELAEEFDEAERVAWAIAESEKTQKSNDGPHNVTISIGKVGDTAVKDSVISGSDEEI